MTETTLYDENNLSGLGKELVAEIEVEIDYQYNRGYPATYMEPGMDDEVEITGCWPTGITIEPVGVPESKDSLLFSRLMNLFADSQGNDEVMDAAKRDAEDRYYDYPDQD